MGTAAIVDALRLQAKGCADYGSPLYAALLARAADDVAAGGVLARLLDDWQGHPILDALAMRLMGAVHQEVLAGRAPALARFYPSVGGVPDGAAAWPAFVALVEDQAVLLRPRLDTQVQTNEVKRTAALLGGFLRVAADTRLPLRVLELGASAGLNLLWDRHRYHLGAHRWGDADAPLRIQTDWTGPPPPLDAKVAVASRAGCDVAPVDVADPAQRQRLEAFVWGDQPARLEELRTAIDLALAERPPVERCPAGEWLGRVLGEPIAGVASVVYQSVIWWYLSQAEREVVTAKVEDAGARAQAAAPLSWLRMEGSTLEECEIRLRSWPGGEDRLLARAHWHGRWVAWLED